MSHLYESFNARNYTPKQVSETFIRNRDYDDLWRNEHTVVLGPRGSGKTTLFKMLTVQAIYSWKDQMAAGLRKERPFTAIYVPTDMHWHHQLKHIQEHLKEAPRFSAVASRAAVTTSILMAIVKTFLDRLYYEGLQNAENEANICRGLIKEWLLPPTLPCLTLVVLALKARISEIRRTINQIVFQHHTDAQITNIPNYFHLDYFATMDFACSFWTVERSCSLFQFKDFSVAAAGGADFGCEEFLEGNAFG
jgi:energy-coupling factor transporter ATP-binding protein EcfA2